MELLIGTGLILAGAAWLVAGIIVAIESGQPGEPPARAIARGILAPRYALDVAREVWLQLVGPRADRVADLEREVADLRKKLGA